MIARPFVIGTLFLAAPAVLLPADARAQARRVPTETAGSEQVAQEWTLRGVVLSEAARFAVLQHRTSSRQQLLRVGDVLARGLALATIAPDRVVLDAEGRAVTLRLAHGGEPVARRAPVRRPLPPPIMRRRGR